MSFATYEHGRVGVHVGRCVPSPNRICCHSWSSVSLTLFEPSAWGRNGVYLEPRSGEDLIHYQRMLVAVLRQMVNRKVAVVGWNGIRRRIFLRVFQGRGSKRDHARFHQTERIAHDLAKLSIAKLKAAIKVVRKKVPELP